MSTPEPHDPPETDSHEPHGAHDEAPPEEPRTPTWLTALGVALLVVVGLGYLMTVEPEPTEEEAVAEPAAAASTAPPAEEAAPPTRRPGGARGMPPGMPPGMRPGGQPGMPPGMRPGGQPGMPPARPNLPTIRPPAPGPAH